MLLNRMGGWTLLHPAFGESVGGKHRTLRDCSGMTPDDVPNSYPADPYSEARAERVERELRWVEGSCVPRRTIVVTSAKLFAFQLLWR
jgi:hypothetical protein